MGGLPLDGIRILDLSRLLPGPFCTLMLADLGADVIKVEDTGAGDYIRWMPPLVDEYSALFHALNRNKRAVSIDLKSEAGRDVFLRLVEGADVVVESFRPGVMERLGVGYQGLEAANPGVVLCSISGYGQNGPYRERVGHDLNYMALAGVVGMTGTTDGGPAIPGVQIGDLGGGAQNAAIAILAALLGRRGSGRGTHVDVAMFDGLVSWQAMQAARFFAGGEVPGPSGHLLNGRHPCYRLYATADSWLAVGALEPKFWREFCDAIDRPHLAGDGLSDGADAERVAAEVSVTLGQRSTAEWMAILADRDVCVEPVLGIDAVLEHPQVLARELVLPAGAGGPLPQLALPLCFDGVRPGARLLAPTVGEHTREVLEEAGIDAAGYAALVEQGAIR